MSTVFETSGSMLQRTTMFVLLAYTVHDVARRPVYVIGHMANSIAYLDAFLAQGANAIEADLSFAANGSATKFFHGDPCESPLNCSAQEEVVHYLTYVRDTASAYASKYYGKMLLFIIDVKTDGAQGNLGSAGASLANNLIDHLWNGIEPKDMMNVSISCYFPEDVELIRSAYDTILRHQLAPVLLDHLGFAVTNGELSVIANIFHRLGIRRHVWQGFAFQNESWKEDNYSRYVRSVTTLRAHPASAENYADKVYVYTVDRAPPVRLLLRHRIDGVITNVPPVVLRVLADPGFTECCRLATSDDDPWKRIPCETPHQPPDHWPYLQFWNKSRSLV
ncbi:dermonecrotic toxin StSicTox-betaIB1i-like isoform X2 [Amblyomma americanum]